MALRVRVRVRVRDVVGEENAERAGGGFEGWDFFYVCLCLSCTQMKNIGKAKEREEGGLQSCAGLKAKER